MISTASSFWSEQNVLRDDDELVRVGVVREKLAAPVVDEHHILVLHAEAVSRLIDERFDAEHHTGLERLVRGAEIRILMQMQADTMTDEGNRRQIELLELTKIEIVDGSARGAGLDGIEQQIFAPGQIVPDPLGVRRWHANRSGTANSGMIAGNHGKNLDPADVAALEDSPGRANIGKHAALAGRNDHQLEIFSALFVNATGQGGGDVHFARAGCDRVVSVGDRFVGNARQRAQDLDLCWRLDLAQSRQQILNGCKYSVRQQFRKL